MKMDAKKPIGEVVHFFNNINVAVVKFGKKIAAGTEVRFLGATTDFKQKLDSMQLDHKEIKEAAKGKEVGIKVKDRVRSGDEVYEA